MIIILKDKLKIAFYLKMALFSVHILLPMRVMKETLCVVDVIIKNDGYLELFG
jgi:hypothetical protein